MKGTLYYLSKDHYPDTSGILSALNIPPLHYDTVIGELDFNIQRTLTIHRFATRGLVH